VSVIGLDVALNNFGYYLNENYFGCWQNSSKLKGAQRLLALLEGFCEVLDNSPVKIEQACLEGYAFNYSKSGKFSQNNLTKLGEAGGIVRVELIKRGIDYVLVAPREVKKFFTGDGAADKEKMMQWSKSFYDKEFSNHNICDAFALHKFGEAYWAGDEAARNGQVNE